MNLPVKRYKRVMHGLSRGDSRLPDSCDFLGFRVEAPKSPLRVSGSRALLLGCCLPVEGFTHQLKSPQTQNSASVQKAQYALIH